MASRWLAVLAMVLGSCWFPSATEAQTEKACIPTVVGTHETFTLTSKVFDNTRTVRVFLPPGYNDAANRERRYPVLYIKEVIPAIVAKYRIAAGRENTGIAGSSYGGIAALYVGIRAPSIFGKVLAESPVLWPGNAKIVRETSFLGMAPQRVFMAYGGKEWDTPGANEAEVRMIRQVETNLKNALVWPSEVRVVLDPEAHHNEEAWARRLPDAISFLFPAR
jgi:predicted alpha/beta superfamily hydrolase